MRCFMFTKEYRIHYRKNWQIAYPLVLGQAGHMLTSIADTLMVGRLGSTELAAASIANTVFIILFVFSIGLSTGVTTIAGKAHGEKDMPLLQSIFFNGLLTTIVVGILITIVMLFASNVIPYLGQEAEVAKLAVPYYKILVFSMFPFMIFLHYKQFTDGLAMTKPGMVITIACNVLNVIMNYLLIYGKLGLPEYGMNGAVIATVIARILMALSFIVLFKYNKVLKIYLKGMSFAKFSWTRILEIFRIGVPIGIQLVLEVGLFVFGAIMTGWVGAEELAAYQIVISLASLTFLMSGGVASTATVRISNLLGERQYHRLRVAGFSAVYMVVIFMFFSGIIFYFGREALPSLFITEPEVIAIASNLMIVAALFQVMDGTQVTALGALRGLQDVNAPTYIALLSYWVVALPICYFLGIYLNYGVAGIWYGYLFGLIVAAVVLLSRFIYISNKLLAK